MANASTRALALTVLLLCAAPGVAGAAPSRSQLIGRWEVEGSDPDGSYAGSLWISAADAGRVRINAALQYANGPHRRWRSEGTYEQGRLRFRYDRAGSSGIAGHLSGPQPPMLDPVQVIYVPAADGLAIRGQATYAGGGQATETLRRPALDLVLRFQVTRDPARRRALALAVGAQDAPATTEAILEAYGVKGMTVNLDPAEVARQTQLANAVPFHSALLLAIDSFQNDAEDAESPHALMVEEVLDALGLPWSNTLPPHVSALTVTRIRTFMRQGSLRLLATTEEPEGGEPVAGNWIFSLDMSDYSDHGHWAVIDRAGRKAVYNYGFN